MDSQNNRQAETKETKHGRRGRRHGFWFGLLAGGLFGAVVAGAVATAGPVLAARAFHGHYQRDPAKALEHAEFATAWILDRVDATDAQKAKGQRIAGQAVNAILPLAQVHRENRDALAAELSRASLDREAIERIRKAEIELADTLSREAVDALTELAETLSPEQRAALVEMVHEHRESR